MKKTKASKTKISNLNKNIWSDAHKKFIKTHKIKTFFIHFFRLILLVAIIGIWELAASQNWVDPFIISSPSRIVKQTIELYNNGTLFLHIGTTLNETILAFLLSTIIGTISAICLYLIIPLRRVLEPYLVVLNSLPKIALGPIIIIWFGAGSKAIVFMCILIVIIVTILNILNSFVSCDTQLIALAKSMGANKLQIFIKLILPNSLKDIVSTLKINVGLSWIGAIMGEYLVSRAGLGYLLIYGGQVFDLNLVMTSTVILCVLASIMYFAVALFEKLMNKFYE